MRNHIVATPDTPVVSAVKIAVTRLSLRNIALKPSVTPWTLRVYIRVRMHATAACVCRLTRLAGEAAALFSNVAQHTADIAKTTASQRDML